MQLYLKSDSIADKLERLSTLFRTPVKEVAAEMIVFV